MYGRKWSRNIAVYRPIAKSIIRLHCASLGVRNTIGELWSHVTGTKTTHSEREQQATSTISRLSVCLSVLVVLSNPGLLPASCCPASSLSRCFQPVNVIYTSQQQQLAVERPGLRRTICIFIRRHSRCFSNGSLSASLNVRRESPELFVFCRSCRVTVALSLVTNGSIPEAPLSWPMLYWSVNLSLGSRYQ